MLLYNPADYLTAKLSGILNDGGAHNPLATTWTNLINTELGIGSNLVEAVSKIKGKIYEIRLYSQGIPDSFIAENHANDKINYAF